MIFLLVSGFLVGCDSRDEARPATTQPAAATKPAGATLPIVDLAALQQIIHDSGTHGQITVIDFWATWCIPCEEMLPDLHEGLVKLGPKVRPVTVTLDADDTVGDAAKFLEEQHAIKDGYALVPDTNKQLAMVAALGKKWDNLVVPAVLVFDEKGALVAEFTLTVKTEDVLKTVGELAAKK